MMGAPGEGKRQIRTFTPPSEGRGSCRYTGQISRVIAGYAGTPGRTGAWHGRAGGGATN